MVSANTTFDHRAFLKTVPDLPGVYRMYNDQDTIIYVGKAKNLSNRLHSYFVANLVSPKTKALVSNIHHIEYTVTPSESDALILEQNLIKEHRPRYNILLRDDKSYPYILVTKEPYPRIIYHRGPQKIKGTYFGPYPNSSAVKDSLKLLQTLFPIRQCTNVTFANRSRPCLLYQIKKCLGPCVKGLVTDEEYLRNVEMTTLFLRGHYQQLLGDLTAQMQLCSENCDFEKATIYRDQIFALRKVQEQQVIDKESAENTDIVSYTYKFGVASINVIFHRNGQILGSHNFFLKCPASDDLSEILASFLEQYYLSEPAMGYPSQVVLPSKLRLDDSISASISGALGKNITLNYPTKGRLVKLLEMGQANADNAMSTKMKSAILQQERIEDLERLFALPVGTVKRMECYDISHTFGERTVASCVVFGRGGPENSLYRIFNITGITPGDDFAAMKQVLQRRFLKAPGVDKLPDILFIDGGDGQMTQAEEVINRCREKFTDYNPLIVGVSKGEGRKHGLETLHMGYTRQELHLPMESEAFLLIQHIRDESHRFAITNHRKQRSSHKILSRLEQIPGIGKQKRQDLLNRFGGVHEITSASRDEIAKVPGIGDKLAGVIYDWLHNVDTQST